MRCNMAATQWAIGGKSHREQSGLAQHRHHHQAHGTVTTDIGLHTALKPLVDHIAVYRIEDDNRLFLHSQGRSCIDPVAIPTRCTQFWVKFFGVTTPLTGDDGIQSLKLIEISRVLEWRHILTDIGCRLARLRCSTDSRETPGR